MTEASCVTWFNDDTVVSTHAHVKMYSHGHVDIVDLTNT
jgi:hypothetical protein